MTSDVTLGRVRTTPDYEYGWVASGQLRTVTVGPPPQHMWVDQIHFYGGEHDNTTPTVSMAIYEADSGKNPTGDRVGYTETITPTNDMNGTVGQVKDLDVTVNDKEPDNTSTLQALTLQLWSNKRYAIGLLSTSGETSHGMSSRATAYNSRFYQRNGLSQPPPSSADPFASSNPEGAADFWVSGQYNVKPEEPPTSTLTPSGSITEEEPVFTGEFRDLNGTWGTANGGKDFGDNMKAFQIIVYDDVENVVWNSGVQSASESERLADEYSIAYDGSTLNRGDTYHQIARVQDQFDAWSGYCDPVYFTITNAGILTLDGAPTGRITSTQTDFAGKYTHPTGLAATHVQVLLMNSNGAIVDESPEIAKAIASSSAPGTSFTVTWAETTFSALTWGSSYYYAMRVRDSAGEWSNYPSFSKTNPTKVRSFRVNSAPNSPTNLSPANGIIKTTIPQLTFDGTDEDQDSTTGLEEWVRIKSKENILNPSFTTDASNFAEQYKDTGWTYTPSRDTVVFQSSPGALKLAVTNAPATSAKLLRYVSSDWLPVVPGESYQWQTYLRKDNINLFVRPVIVFETSGGVEVETWRTTDPGYAINTWNLAVVTGVAPATSARMKVGIELYNQTTGAVSWNAWIDTINPMNWQVRSYQEATYSSGKWRLTPNADDDEIVTYQEYRWDAFAYDGFVYSGRALSAAAAQKSVERSFVYALGPSVSITTPADDAVLTTSRLEVAWVAATQTKYRVVLYDVTNSQTAYDTGLITDSVTKAIVIPAGTVRNGRTYRLTVSVKDVSNLDGEDVHDLTSVFDATGPLANFTVTGYSFPGDAEPSGIIASWDPTTIPLVMWQYYRLERIDPTGERTELKKMYSPSQTSYIDSTPASGVQYRYELSQIRLDGADYIPSDEQVAEFAIDLPGVVLSSVIAPDERRVMLHFATSRSRERKKQAASRIPLAGITHPKTGLPIPPKPVTITSKARWFIFDGDYDLVTDLTQGSGITAQDRFDQLEALDISNDVICYRDERGTRKFVKIGNLKIVDRRPDIYSVQIDFTEETYYEIYTT
jgi:hypothetical protein